MFKITSLTSTIKQLVSRIRAPRYQVIYKPARSEGVACTSTKCYVVSPIRRRNEFDNQVRGEVRIGFRAFCHTREGVRSFRYDRIKSMQKLGLFENWEY